MSSMPHDRVNFNLRPNKRIERRIVAEALACIYRYDDPRNFGYIGMGSYYFSDFLLFHKTFGIQRMISIEFDTDNSERFNFNKPLGCITMSYGNTSDALPILDIYSEGPIICWLDYYDRLTSSILGDIRTVLSRAQTGSALLVTLNSSLITDPAKISSFLDGISSIANTSANRKRLNSIANMQEFMLDEIEQQMEVDLSDLNQGRLVADKVSLKRIINITYKDGVQMVTFGWLLLNPSQEGKLHENPSIFSNEANKYSQNISAPILTFREISHLKRLLPTPEGDEDYINGASPIKESDARHFASLYRHFPHFADIEE